MFSKLMQIILVSTSISPVCLTLWFKSFSKHWNIKEGITYLIIAIVLFTLLFLIINLAKTKLEKLPLKVTQISNADKESLPFIFSYIIPLLDIEMSMVIFLLLLFFFIVFTTNIYHFNPLLGFLGYHQYEVTIENGTTFILLTKKTLINVNQIKRIAQLTNYIIIDMEE